MRPAAGFLSIFTWHSSESQTNKSECQNQRKIPSAMIGGDEGDVCVMDGCIACCMQASRFSAEQAHAIFESLFQCLGSQRLPSSNKSKLNHSLLKPPQHPQLIGSASRAHRGCDITGRVRGE